MEVCSKPGCNQLTSQRCKRCKLAYYCNKDCQRAMWKSHKLMCYEEDGKGVAQQERKYTLDRQESKM